MQGTDPSVLPGRVSPDGLWRWDGVRWEPAASLNPPPPLFGSAPATEAFRSERSGLASAGGITAIIATVIVFFGCALPYVHYSGDVSGVSASPSVFHGGFSGDWGNIAEPLVVILFSLAASIVVIAAKDRTARAFSSGALLAMGAQVITLFVGYDVAGASYGQLQAGGIVGPLGGIVLFVGGAMAAASLLVRPATGTPRG